jgi:peptidoglycan/xylan/chitin deacetylase (PgdA/CDA1 family)
MPGLPVLTFHAVDPLPTPVAVSAATFDGMVRRLAAEGRRAVSLDAVADYVRLGRPLGERPVLLTFDDGYASVDGPARAAVAAGVGATLFLCPTLLDRPRIFPGDPLCPDQPALTWRQARDLATAGVVIGSHAWEHVDLRALDDAALEDSLRRSRGDLEAKLGAPVRSLAYPFGYHDARVVAAAAKVYDLAFTTELRRATPGCDPYRIPRLDAWYLRYLARRGSLDAPATAAYLAARRFARAVRSRLAGGPA